MKSNKGLALIVVLWVITLLTIMASSFALTALRPYIVVLQPHSTLLNHLYRANQ
jgi:Tfp pilus assembly protein PilX